jgi:hypothetical protein
MKTYLEYLFWDARLVELRHQTNGRWVTGWFDDPDALRRESAARLDVGNLFTSLHRPCDRVVSNTMSGSPLKNEDVERFIRLFFDFDPVRETDTASTDEQVALARVKAEAVAKVLRMLGWPEPLQALSGNGWHLQYRIALPNSEETRQQLKVVYTGLSGEFSDDQVVVDPTVRNAGRICTLYGSIKRKGPDSSRHRRSQVWIPREWRQIRPKHFETVADFYASQQKTVEAYQPRPAARIDGDGDYSTLDVVSWFRSHGQYHEQAEPGKHYVRCPWEAEHSDGVDAQVKDTVVWDADGNWPTFFCSHAHCEGRTIRDVMSVWGDADAFCGRRWDRA